MLLRVLCIVRKFLRANQANVAVTFAIVSIPLISFVGAAVDYTRAASARSSMQVALDSTALMLSRDLSQGIITTAQLTSKAQAEFAALYTNTDASGVTVTATYTASTAAGSTILLNSSGTVTTAFMKMVGFPTMGISTSSTAAWGTTKLRVALALDNTGSMADDGKMSALQTASKNLITQLSASANNPGDVYISIVPFANVVNLGTSFNTNYIDWSNWSTSGSIEEGWTCGSKYNVLFKTMVCGSSANNTSKWGGCVIDRNQSYDVQITPPTGLTTYYPADQSSYCPTQLAPLSYNWTSLNATISSMSPSGGTNQAIGLVWAWQTLQQAIPYNAPSEDPNYTYVHAIILLSDGLNTMDRWYGNGSVWSPQVDARQMILCDNIKAAGVTIYTIQVNTGGDPTSAVLSYCASGTSNFFMLTSASQVLSTFNSIGTSLTKLRIAN